MIGSTQYASDSNLTSLGLGEFFNPGGALSGPWPLITTFSKARGFGIFLIRPVHPAGGIQ